MKHMETIGARMASYVNIPKELSENICFAIQNLGIDKLYCHQVDFDIFSYTST